MGELSDIVGLESGGKDGDEYGTGVTDPGRDQIAFFPQFLPLSSQAQKSPDCSLKTGSGEDTVPCGR